MTSNRNPKKARLFLLMAILLSAYFILSFSKGYFALIRIRGEIQETQGRVEKMTAENRSLEKEIYLLKTSEYIERLAREQLGLVKEGEISVIMIREE